MDLGPHAAFIVTAYGLAALIVGAMIAWITLDHRRQTRSLADLEARGVTRRSERPAGFSGESLPGT
jgi:heme exporter protein D